MLQEDTGQAQGARAGKEGAGFGSMGMVLEGLEVGWGVGDILRKTKD